MSVTIRETIHHGDHRAERDVEIEDLSLPSVAKMLRDADPGYVRNATGDVAAQLATRGEAERGWVRWVIVDPVEDDSPPPYACAECGTTTATEYVVTTLDPASRAETTTEVCLPCHNAVAGIVLATISTGSYVFAVVAATEEAANAALIAQWAVHVAQTGANPDMMAEAVRDGDVNYSTTIHGAVLRDGRVFA